MKRILTLAGVALLGSMVGVALKTIIANHTAASQPPANAVSFQANLPLSAGAGTPAYGPGA